MKHTLGHFEVAGEASIQGSRLDSAVWWIPIGLLVLAPRVLIGCEWCTACIIHALHSEVYFEYLLTNQSTSQLLQTFLLIHPVWPGWLASEAICCGGYYTCSHITVTILWDLLVIVNFTMPIDIWVHLVRQWHRKDAVFFSWTSGRKIPKHQ